MASDAEHSQAIFSFHLVSLPLLKVPQRLLSSGLPKKIPGLNHAEHFFTMRLGEPILSLPRYQLKNIAFFAWWKDELSLTKYLEQPTSRFFNRGWHVRMRLYRRWGEVSELKNTVALPHVAVPDRPMVAVTLARLKILQTPRFIRWGKPVESQVRDHCGQTLALAGLRPLNTFSTFSVWKKESEMTQMVQGRNKLTGGESHSLAMQERIRNDFHHEFTTMRFAPFKELGTWNGISNYTLQ